MLARLRILGQASAVAGVTEKEREVMFKSAATLGECRPEPCPERRMPAALMAYP